ncbi:hypothetical protein SAMN05421869_102515 [Nonomuraea jiangxiensis]|uniref:Uncharacterized protein n=1 Tax=Nonomuraea jiangxiensis TaxID=633440 RepID=A0A1G8DAP3_9ACTN|nr:hypothetical protein SAMN05421869_102515 [Nonomuraea jiangxiensis]
MALIVIMRARNVMTVRVLRSEVAPRRVVVCGAAGSGWPGGWGKRTLGSFPEEGRGTVSPRRGA